MNTLILTISAGGGHNAAASAISDYINHAELDSNVVIIDTLKYISPVLDKVFIGTYLNSLKIYPKAYDFIYSASNKPDENFTLVVDRIEEMIVTRLLPLLIELKPDIILATHPITSQMVNLLRKKHNVKTPSMVIMTDYGTHTMWVHPGIDYYVVAHEDMIPELTELGRSQASILPLGIPVRSSFKGEVDRKVTLQKIGLDPDLLTVTLMGGSLGMGRIRNILNELDDIPRKFNIAVITATNEKLYDDAIEISLQSDKSIAVLKYCDFMNAMMNASDLLITKPGGLTIAEALISGVPMAIFSAIGGQEGQNSHFLVSNGLAIDIGDGEGASQLIEDLLFDKQRLLAMADQIKLFAKPNSTEDIYHQMKKMIEEQVEPPDYSKLGTQVEMDEGNLEKFKNFMEDFKAKVESNRIMSKVMDLVRRNDMEDFEETFYELSEDEVSTIIEESLLENLNEKQKDAALSPPKGPSKIKSKLQFVVKSDFYSATKARLTRKLKSK